MKVNVDELRGYPQQKIAINFKETLEGLDAVKPVVGELMLLTDSCGVRLSGRVTTLLKLSCHRCLRAYFQSLNVDIDERFVRQYDSEPAGDRELQRKDFVEPIPADGVLDIDDIVYQAVTLATPSNCYCGQECPGMPLPEPGSGEVSLGTAKEKEAGVDPRWKNLKTLFPNKESEEKS